MTHEALPLFRAAAAGRLEMTYCPRCRRWIWFPKTLCPICDEATEWRQTVGTATLVSFTVERRGTVARWRDQTPYVIAAVRLDEGVVMLSNVVDVEPATLTVGERLIVEFAATEDPQLAVPIFRRPPAVPADGVAPPHEDSLDGSRHLRTNP